MSMGMSWKTMKLKATSMPVLTESRTAHLSSRAWCRGSWLVGAVVKDLSWAVKQPPRNAVVPSHSEPGLSRNQILTLSICVCSLHICISEGSSPWNLLPHGKFSTQQKRSSVETVSKEPPVSVTEGW